MFDITDIAEYYDTTLNHYKRWWNLSESHSLHYGIWDKDTKNFAEALINTNKVLMELSEMKNSDIVLDAGCGVGGTAIYLHEHKKNNITGITLSRKQLDFANTLLLQKGYTKHLNFQLMDYTKTNFDDRSFDIVLGCESISSAPNKLLFMREAHRLLKKGGRLIMSDYFLTNENVTNSDPLIQKWRESWALSNLDTSKSFEKNLENVGFKKLRVVDYTSQIKKSAKRMFYASLLGTIPSEIYKIFNPNVSRFAKNHYRSGIYQYKALGKNLWKYKVIVATKEN